MGSLYVYFLVPLLVASLSANMSPSPRRIVIVTRMVATPPPKASSRETTSADLPMNIKRELKKAYKLHLRFYRMASRSGGGKKFNAAKRTLRFILKRMY